MLKLIVNRCHRFACRFIDSSPRWPILIALLVFAAYFIGAQLSFILRVPSTRSSIIWAPNAVLLTAFVATPPQTWWIWILAATPAHVIAQARDAAPLLLLLCPFVANVAQALLAAVALRRLMDPPYRLETFRDMVVFILVAVLAAPAVASFTCAALFVAAGWENDYWVVATARMLNNMVTGLAVTPLCFALVDFERAWFHRFRLRRFGELTLILVALSLAASLSSIWQISEPLNRLLRLYAPLPFLVWAAVRFPPAGLAVGLLIVAYESIADSIAGHGIFTRGSATANVLAIEASLFAISLPLMLLAALMRERQRKEEALRESEARYRALVTATSEIVWRANPGGEVFSVTPTWRELTGQTEEELCRSGWLEVVHPEDREKYQRLWNRTLAKRQVYENELRIRTREHNYRHFHIHAVPILDADGSVREWVGAATDITDRKRAESILRESEAVFRNMAEHAPVMIWVSDTAGARTYVNKQWSDFTGITGEAALGSRWLDSVHPEDRERARTTLAKAHERREKTRLEFHQQRHDGEYRWVINSAIPRFDNSGEFLGFIGSVLDITERKRAESRLQVQYRVTRVLSDSVSLASAAPALTQIICECLDWDAGELWQLGPDGSALTYFDGYSVSSNFAEFIASSRAFTFESGAGLPGRVWQSGSAEWITRVADAADSPRAELARKVGLKSAFACPIKLSDRTFGVMAFFGRSIREPDAELLQVMESIGRQIGQFVERKQAEAALRVSEERKRAIFESALDSIITVDQGGTILEFNAAAERAFGYERSYALGRQITGLIASPDQNHRGLAHFLTSGVERILDKRIELTATRSDGHEFPVELAVTRVSLEGPPIYTAYIRDITARRRGEEALRHALAEVQRLKERAEADNVYLREELSEAHRDGEIVGQSECLRNILRQVRQVAVTDMSVLIMGETGTGKELVARAIHEHSARRQRPLVKVNCSALPAELMESELFGHEKGAFTGAAAQRIGRFELADGGTIFLDEIGDLAPGLQTKLLRVLQEGEFERVGSSKTIRVNVRVIAATNRDLSEAMRKETFRTDLYYRLAVYPIHMPPLRERKEDIALLAEAFLREASQRLGRSFEGIPRRVIEALERYEWPGNVRELQNAIERAAVTSPGAVLELPEVWHPEVKPSKGAPYNNGSDSVPRAAGSTLALLERAHILQVLKQTHWRIEGPKGAAVLLGLRPSTLRSRMRKLGIDRNTDGSPQLDELSLKHNGQAIFDRR